MVDLAPDQTDFPLAEHPRLRPIEVFPLHERGRRSLVLRDPADPKISPIVISDGAADVLMLLDGQRTLAEPDLMGAWATFESDVSEMRKCPSA